ncbi:hypothetical protein C6I21_11480 [Alkalicoccus urumqiensis]|uniref:Uncharacterized protein n=2 Tax=Alkalicoccus urumqiensis TaxID=1548213 RepID=A0A2P6MFN4_ALKUR|nr:hypothetical protein C6I21_11480 [Alkalicoccus urumqiensis]
MPISNWGRTASILLILFLSAGFFIIILPLGMPEVVQAALLTLLSSGGFATAFAAWYADGKSMYLVAGTAGSALLLAAAVLLFSPFI